MDDSGILQHLLEIEGKAATLVDGAQAEADRRIKEAEEQNRLAFDEAYQKLTVELEEEYKKSIDAVKAEYEKNLDEYRAGLENMPKNQEEFSALLRSFLADKK
jgi:vacuolar-type H+-ATPase subunit H